MPHCPFSYSACQSLPPLQEMLKAQAAQSRADHQQVNIDDLLDDPELERLHAERLYALQKEAERRLVLQQKGHGEYQEVEEGQFLQANRFVPHLPSQQLSCYTFSAENGGVSVKP